MPKLVLRFIVMYISVLPILPMGSFDQIENSNSQNGKTCYRF